MRHWSWVMAVALAVLTGGAVAGLWIYDADAAQDTTEGVVTANGRLEIREVRVAPATGGRVRAMRVREGERVRAGDTLALLDRRSQEAAAAAGRAALAAAGAGVRAAERRALAVESRLSLARLEARRYRRLYERDAAPRQAAERAEAALAQLRNEFGAAEAAHDLTVEEAELARSRLRSMEVELDETVVTAPVDGLVSDVPVREGEMAAPGLPVVVLRRTGDVVLDVYLPLHEAGRIRPGASARVRLDAFPDRVFPGTVDHVASEAEFTPRDIHMPDERTTLVYEVVVQVRDPEGLLRDGFPADAEIRWDETARWPEEGRR